MEKLIYTNNDGLSIELSNLKPFLLESIQGVGGLESVHTMSETPFQNGASYSHSRIQPRTIVIDGAIVGINKENMFKNRQKLIKVFKPGKLGSLIYSNNYSSRRINCIVDLAPIWKEKVRRIQKFTIQLLAPNPFWNDINDYTESVSSWLGAFEFPLELTNDLIFGYRENNLIKNIINKGDIECGFTAKLKALAKISNPKIIHIESERYISLNVDLYAGDTLIINTGFGCNDIYIERVNGVVEDAYIYTDIESEFFWLNVGDNLIKYEIEGNEDMVELLISYDAHYLGL